MRWSLDALAQVHSMTYTSSILAPALGPILRLAESGRRLRVTGQGWRLPTTDSCCGEALLIPVTILACDVSHFTTFSGVVGCILRIDARACMRRAGEENGRGFTSDDLSPY